MKNTESSNSIPEKDSSAETGSNPSSRNQSKEPAGRRSLPGRRKPDRSGKDSPSRSLDDPPWDPEPSPHHDNMGGDTAKSPGTVTGYRFYDVEPAGAPDDYYYDLVIDAAQVATLGEWESREAAAEMYNWRTLAEQAKKLGLPLPRFVCADGVELDVYPHGGKAGYHVLMKAFEQPEVRVVPHMVGLPTFLIRFGAKWCLERSLEEIELWIRKTCSTVGFRVEKVVLSEVHIRCDVPTPFGEADLKKMRGLGTRGGNHSVYYTDGELSTITNIGGKKSITYSIYNKRVEQKRKRGTLWPGVWIAYSIPADSPVWRVEARFRSERLRHLGVYLLSDLDHEALEHLWHDFSSRYLKFVENPSKRSDRAGVDSKWLQIAASGARHDKPPIKFKTNASLSHGIKTAAGHVRREMKKIRVVATKGAIIKMVDDVLDQVTDKNQQVARLSQGEILKYVQQRLDALSDESFTEEKSWKKWLETELEQKLGLSKPEDRQSFLSNDGGENDER